MIFTHKIINIVLVLVFFWCNGFAQKRFRQVSVPDGFPSKYAQGIVKDTCGFIWVATYDGVYRYDGHSMQGFDVYVDSVKAPIFNPVWALFVDSHGELWVGGNYGLARYNSSHHRLELVTDTLFHSFQIDDISEDELGNMWFASAVGLIRYQRESQAYSIVTKKISTKRLLVDGNTIYLGTRKNGVALYDITMGKITFEINPGSFNEFMPQHQYVHALEKSLDGNIWFATELGGLYEYSPSSREIKRHPIVIEGQETKLFFRTLMMDGEELWIGTTNGGLIVYNSKTGTSENYRAKENSRNSLSSNSIYRIDKDRSGIVWLSTHMGGVCYYVPSDEYMNYFGTGDTDNSLTGNVISTVEHIDSSHLLVGSDGGGLNILNTRTNTIKRLGAIKGMKSLAVTKIVRDMQNHMWVAQWEGGVSRYKVDKGDLLLESTFGVNISNTVKGLYADKKGRVWLLPFNSPLQLYDTRNGRLLSVDTPGYLQNETFIPRQLAGGVEDNKGNIFLYGSDGILKIDMMNMASLIRRGTKSSMLLVSNRIYTMFVDSRGGVWICTTEGVVQYDNSVDSIVKHKEKEFDNMIIYAMQEDRRGGIWFTSNNGIGYYDAYATVKFRYFDRNIPISGSDFLPSSTATTNDGLMAFGSSKGLVIFNADKLLEEKAEPNIMITELSIFNKPVLISEGNSILAKPIDITDTVELSYKHSVISFTFAALCYVSPDKNKYSYYLDGFDEKWNSVKNERKAYYTNLDPGTYTLMVKASNNEDIWTTQLKKLTIIIRPPWWKTWWFQTIAMAFVLLSASSFYLIRVIGLKRRNRILAEKVQERTHMLHEANEELTVLNEELLSQNDTLYKHEMEIEQQNVRLKEQNEEIETQKEELESKNNQLNAMNAMKDRFFSIIAHDLKNPMNSLMGLSELLMNNPDYPSEKRQLFVSLINKSSHNLYDLLVNLLNWARSQSNAIELRFEDVCIHSVVSETILVLQEQASTKGITIENQLGINNTIYADKMTISTVIRNLISNALKYTNEGGLVTISLYETDVSKVISVTDTGIGMTDDQVNKLFRIDIHASTPGTNKEAGTGLGLILCKEFVEKNNGEIWANSTPGKGSTFSFSIPK